MAKKVNRIRNRSIQFRMDENEYKCLCKKIESSAQTQQAYILSAVSGLRSITPEELQLLQNANRELSDIYRCIRGIGNNINQMARYANTVGQTAQLAELQDIKQKIDCMQKEVGGEWQSLRSLIQALQGMQH
ncbi:MAG: MobC family plasmid mobilization relaxosome protein [Butyrivibrio sp.]|nr:MobC family plasmid mobilization relaxosome protein [Butyrivibrio sp.]